MWISSFSRPFEFGLKFAKTGYKNLVTLLEIFFDNQQECIHEFCCAFFCQEVVIKLGKENALDLFLLFFEVDIFHDTFDEFRFSEGHSSCSLEIAINRTKGLRPNWNVGMISEGGFRNAEGGIMNPKIFFPCYFRIPHSHFRIPLLSIWMVQIELNVKLLIDPIIIGIPRCLINLKDMPYLQFFVNRTIEGGPLRYIKKGSG